MTKKYIPENVTIKDYYEEEEEMAQALKEANEDMMDVYNEYVARLEADRLAASTGWSEAAQNAAFDVLEIMRNIPPVAWEDLSFNSQFIFEGIEDICKDVLHDIFADIPTEAANE